MTGFEGHGDFDSADPWERYAAKQASRGRKSLPSPEQIDLARKKAREDRPDNADEFRRLTEGGDPDGL